jgi:hypothetical protein
MEEMLRAKPAATGHGPRMSDQLDGLIDPEDKPTRRVSQATSRKRLAAALLKDRERRNQKPRATGSTPRAPNDGFDPFAITRWRVIGSGDPGYLVKAPMRKGSTGWWVECGCGERFESTGGRHCRKVRPKLVGRPCQVPVDGEVARADDRGPRNPRSGQCARSFRPPQEIRNVEVVGPRPGRIAAVPTADGGAWLGYTFARGRQGVEAFDRHDKSIGIFATLEAAADGLAQHNNGDRQREAVAASGSAP